MQDPSNISIHWLAFSLPITSRVTTEEQISQALEQMFNIDLASCRLVKQFRKVYKSHYNYGNRLCIYFDGAGDNRGHIFFDLNGKGCDELSPRLEVIAKYVLECGGHFVKLDAFIDDVNHRVDFQELVLLSDEEHYRDRLISRFRGPAKYIKCVGETLQFGSFHSKTRITIYEKGKYEGYPHDYNRFEIKLHDRQELAVFMNRILQGEHLGLLVRESFSNYLDFKVAGPQPKKQRATIPMWSAFLNDVQARAFGRNPKKKQDTNKVIANLTQHNMKKRNELGDRLYLKGLLPILLCINYDHVQPVMHRLQAEEEMRQALEGFSSGVGGAYQLPLPFEEKPKKRRFLQSKQKELKRSIAPNQFPNFSMGFRSTFNVRSGGAA